MIYNPKTADLFFNKTDFFPDASGKLVLTPRAKHELSQQNGDIKKITFQTKDNYVFACFAALNDALNPTTLSQDNLTPAAIAKLKAIKTFSFEVGISDQIKSEGVIVHEGFNSEVMQAGVDRLLEASQGQEFDIELSFNIAGYSAAKHNSNANDTELAASKALLRTYVNFCERLPERLAANPNLHLHSISNLIKEIRLEKLLLHCHEIKTLSDLSLISLSEELIDTLKTSCPLLEALSLTGDLVNRTKTKVDPGCSDPKNTAAEEYKYEEKVIKGVNLAPLKRLKGTHPNLKVSNTPTINAGSKSSKDDEKTIPVDEIVSAPQSPFTKDFNPQDLMLANLLPSSLVTTHSDINPVQIILRSAYNSNGDDISEAPIISEAPATNTREATIQPQATVEIIENSAAIPHPRLTGGTRAVAADHPQKRCCEIL